MHISREPYHHNEERARMHVISWGNRRGAQTTRGVIEQDGGVPQLGSGKGRICNTLVYAFRPGWRRICPNFRGKPSPLKAFCWVCLNSEPIWCPWCAKEGCEKIASGATTQASSNAELLSGRSERRCGAHIHADRGLYALSSPYGSKNSKWSSGIWLPGSIQVHVEDGFTNWLNSASLSPPRGGRRWHTSFFDCGNQPGCFIFTCAHPGGSALDLSVLARAKAELS